MADAVSVLREEIATLEQEINKRNRALAVLTSSVEPVKSPTVPAKSPTAPVKKVPAVLVKSSPPPRPTPPPTATPAATSATAPVGPTLGERILTYLAANKGKLLAPVQIAKALVETDKNVKPESVQRRLGELFKRKRVKRDNGRYGLA